jgi:translation elongation factor EF-Ts
MIYVDNEKDYEWSKISTDVIPFLARNQFKEILHKMLEEATKDKTKKNHHAHAMIKDQANRIEHLFNNSSTESKKVSINIVGHIDKNDSMNAYLRMENTKVYIRANLEGQKLIQKFHSTKGQYQLEYKLF